MQYFANITKLWGSKLFIMEKSYLYEAEFCRTAVILSADPITKRVHLRVVDRLTVFCLTN